MTETQIHSRTRISVSGKGLYKFINALHSGKVCCSGQFCRKDVFYCEIPSSALPEVRSLAEEHGLELTAAEYSSLSSKLKSYRRRLGILIGLIAVIAAAVYFSGVVVTIDVQGNSAVSDQALLAALDELGVRPGTPLKDINFHVIGNQLRVMVDGVSWAAVRHTGNRVVVEVTEIREKPDMVSERLPCNLVAVRDAEITYTSVYDGQLIHKVGDFVPAGTLVVSGITDELTGHVMLHHAMGVIKGSYEETVTFQGEFMEERYVRTGEERSCDRLKLFDLKIPLFIGRNKYSTYDSEVSEDTLHFFGRELPIGRVREKLCETERVTSERTPDELREQLMKKVYLYEKNFLSDGTDILRRDISETVTDSGMELTVRYKLNGDICREEEIITR